MIRVFEAFSGYGSQATSLKRLGIPFEVVAISEIDKYAIQAYEALHGKVLNLGDISKINVDDVPDHDLFTYSFPCQDISVAGKQAGIAEGTRSGLLWECERIIAGKKPKYLLMENVKNLVGKKHKPAFEKWCEWLESQGYANYWQVLNAKDYGVPQNRERVFMVSMLGEHEPYVFPVGFDNGIRLKDILEDEVDEKYYITNEKAEKLISQLPKKDYVFGCDGTINEPKERDRANCIKARYDAGISNFRQDGTMVCEPMVRACITPDRLEKRQNGRRFKEDGEPMFTLTSQDRHGVVINESIRLGGLFDGETKHQAGSVWDTKGLAPTLDTMQGGYRQPCIVDKVVCEQRSDEGLRFFKGDYCGTIRTIEAGGDKRVLERREQAVAQNYRIRKLTPRECFRLMGLHDDEIDKIQEAGISNSQQYKMAGNSIVVDVLEHIFKELFVE